MSLTISSSLSLPDEAVTQTFAVLAKRGVGKSYLAAVMTEEMLKAGHHVVVIDPIGVFWGLRSSATGEASGLPIIILGGDHADLPLDVTSGQLIADIVVEERVSLVLDLSLLRKAESVRFLTDFSETLYRKNRNPLHLMMDEADAYAPQRPVKGQERMLGAVEDLVRRGRARGIGMTLITQRSAVLNKDVLTQVEVLVAMRTIAPQDREAVDAWVKVHGEPGQREELMASLPALPIGTAWFWSPGWLDLFQKVQVRHRETFDSSATPKVGEIRTEPKVLAPVDIEQLRSRLTRPEPKKTPSVRVEKIIERVEVPFFSDDDRRVFEAMHESLKGLDVYMQSTLKVLEDIAQRMGSAVVETPSAPELRSFTESLEDMDRVTERRNGALPLAQRRVMTALAQHGALTKRQVAILSGYSWSSGSFATTLSALRSAGYIGRGEPIAPTTVGLAALGDFESLPSGVELHEWWYTQLGKGERAILQTLIAVYPLALSREEVAERTNYSATSGSFATYLSKLRTLALIEGSRILTASPSLFA